MRAIAIANQKGGVGKTTTAVTLAHGLALYGYFVLLIDLDPQGHVAESLGLEKCPGLFNLLVMNEPLEDVVIQARERLDIVPGDKSTERAKRFLSSEPLSHKVFQRLLKAASHDVVIFDCAPSFDLLHIATLVACDRLLIPTRLEHLACDGVNEILISAGQLRDAGESKVSLICILPTFFERVTRETSEQLRDLAKQFGSAIWPPIPQDTRVREASAFGKTLWKFARASPSVIGYDLGDGAERIGGYQDTLERLMVKFSLEGVEDD